MAIRDNVFGNYKGEEIKIYTLYNVNGMLFSCIPYGAIITEIRLPDPQRSHNLVLGFDNLESYTSESYRSDNPYMGAVVGRNAGRISDGRLTIKGQVYQLIKNYPNFQLHGGSAGFDSVVWDVVSMTDGPEPSILFRYVSADGEQGFPGCVTSFVRYTLTSDNELLVQMEATTDASTVINLTQHTYFNFNESIATLDHHDLLLPVEKYLGYNEFLIPNGELYPVAGAQYDFRTFRPVQPKLDCSFVNTHRHCATLKNTANGIQMKVYTNRPIVHIYTGDGLKAMPANGKRPIAPYGGICFETQGYSDAPNHPNFPTTIIHPGDMFRLETMFKFSV